MAETDLNSLVSIIIPLYNSEEYLSETIESCLNQTWPNIEIIIVDDGSTDKSLLIAKGYNDKRIKIYHQENKNAAAARNKGLKHSTGDFIQFLDSDDLLSRDKIKEQITLLLAHPGKVAVCSTIHFNKNQDRTKSSASAYEEAFLIDAAPYEFLVNLYGGNGKNGSMVQPNAWLCPRNIIEQAGPWNESLTLDDDGEYFCRVALRSAGVLKSKGLNYYRKHSQRKNLSSRVEEKYLKSQYDSLTLKISHLKLVGANDLRKMHARWLYELLFKAYPTYTQLVKQINNDIKRLNIDYKPLCPFGTRSGKILCKLFGWKFTKLMQRYKHILIPGQSINAMVL
jgi:glycosyltransferase involved in cell wall biosynthesis